MVTSGRKDRYTLEKETRVTAQVEAGPAAGAAELIPKVVAAWAAHDADAFADLFTRDGTMIIQGVFVKGREEIRGFLAAAYAGPFRGTRVTGAPVDARSLSDGCSLVLTEGGILFPGETEVDPARQIRASWLAVRDEEGWRLAAYQNTPSMPATQH